MCVITKKSLAVIVILMATRKDRNEAGLFWLEEDYIQAHIQHYDANAYERYLYNQTKWTNTMGTPLWHNIGAIVWLPSCHWRYSEWCG